MYVGQSEVPALITSLSPPSTSCYSQPRTLYTFKMDEDTKEVGDETALAAVLRYLRKRYVCDNEDDRTRRLTSMVIGVVCFTLGLLWVHTVVQIPTIYGLVAVVLSIIIGLVNIVNAVRATVISSAKVEVLTYLTTFVIISGDANISRKGEMFWQFVVLVIDLCLVNKLPCRATFLCLAFTCVWLFVSEILQVTRYKLPDVTEVSFPPLCDCEEPPCMKGVLVAVTSLSGNYFVLLADFVMTRGFATQVLEEKSIVAASVDTAEELATCLASFDLLAADRIMSERTNLPPRMRDAFFILLQNLRSYKPYLPKSCLPMDDLALEMMVPDNNLTPKDTDRSGSFTSCIRTSISHHSETGLLQPVLAPLISTLVVTNIHNSATLFETNHAAELCSFFSDLVTRIMKHTEERRGMVDVFCGDRIYSSFNASRRCVRHVVGAVAATKRILCYFEKSDAAFTINTALASGRVLCGELGCNDMRRFTYSGSLTLQLNGLERAGRRMGVSNVCCANICQDVQYETGIEVRMCPRLVRVEKYFAEGSAPTVLHDGPVYTVLTSEAETGPGTNPQSGAGEWLYELEAKAMKSTAYNEVMLMHVSGRADQGECVQQLLKTGADDDLVSDFSASLKGGTDIMTIVL